MQKLILSVAVLGLVLCAGCTENIRAKAMGGEVVIKLPPGQKFLNVTWKEGNLWYLHRTMRTNEVPEDFMFDEKSAYGVVEGRVIFREWRPELEK